MAQLPTPPQFDLRASLALRIDYTNKKGERRLRWIIPTGIRHTEADPAEWLLDAWDLEKQEFKSYIFDNIHGFTR